MFVAVTKKRLLTFLFSFLISASFIYYFLSQNNVVPASKNNDSWGLNYNTSNGVPLGNATPEYLKNFNAFFMGNQEEKKIYLTFDAGYEAGYTDKILETLQKQNVKATFFVVGTYITSNPELIQKMVNDGHIVGNHTQTHPDMSKMSTMDDFKKQIEPVEAAFQNVTGKQMCKFYRPPQGVYSELNLKMAQELGYKTVFWSLAYVDWYQDKQPTREQAFDKLLPRIHNGTILLLHSTSKTNSEILDELITKIKEAGYTFGTLEELN